MPGTISDDVILRWWEEGYTAREISDMSREQYGVEISPSAIYKKAQRRGSRKKVNLPWSVAEAHRDDTAYTVVRNYLRREAGFQMSALHASQLETWMRDLDETGQVIDYDPKVGFTRVPRRDGEVVYRPPDGE